VKYDGEWIYLVPMENAPGRVDSVKITNASFSFSGQGEEMRVLRLRHLLRIYIQELLVVTEPGTIHVKADSVGSVTGTPQNDALQKWKEGREKKQEAYHFIRTGLRNATGKDSLHLIRIRDSLRMQEQETNFLPSHHLIYIAVLRMPAFQSHPQQHRTELHGIAATHQGGMRFL
jgi:hypothetical protein